MILKPWQKLNLKPIILWSLLELEHDAMPKKITRVTETM
jgi:hypothetical protein